jgi:hypothetical protein
MRRRRDLHRLLLADEIRDPDEEADRGNDETDERDPLIHAQVDHQGTGLVHGSTSSEQTDAENVQREFAEQKEQVYRGYDQDDSRDQHRCNSFPLSLCP